MRVSHTPEGLAKLDAWLTYLLGGHDKEQMACIIETSHGLLIAFLLEHGWPVYAINPRTVDRKRSASGAKTDAIDAYLLAKTGRADFADLHRLTPDSEKVAELKGLTRDLQQLREVVWSKREQIRAFLAHSDNYARKARQTAVPSVVCHGDAWGGNLIRSLAGHLTLLDWESAVMAPPERDAFIYIGVSGPDFTAFDAGYRLIHKDPMHWHADWLAYYSYRLQLRNLAHWLHNLLHEPLDEVQRDNDVNMIEYHCLNRLERVEQNAMELITSLAW